MALHAFPSHHAAALGVGLTTQCSLGWAFTQLKGRHHLELQDLGKAGSAASSREQMGGKSCHGAGRWAPCSLGSHALSLEYFKK
jgi:hypothetical protein